MRGNRAAVSTRHIIPAEKLKDRLLLMIVRLNAGFDQVIKELVKNRVTGLTIGDLVWTQRGHVDRVAPTVTATLSMERIGRDIPYFSTLCAGIAPPFRLAGEDRTECSQLFKPDQTNHHGQQ